ncbi:MAG: hypothetical protein GY703_13775 [Gammaproteobacteria bacterium]|nr:hypothetical protein [Gammaproteobacteria bacterium]
MAVEPFVARLVAGVIQLGRDDGDSSTLIADIGWMLVNVFGGVTRALGFDVLMDLLNERSENVQLLAAQLVLNHGTPIEALPPAILRILLEAKSAHVRALGAQLFSRLSDETLLAQPALVLKLALSHDAQVRQAAHPVVHRLAQADRSFSTLALARLMDSLFRSEPVEGLHEDTLKLIKESLAITTQSIDVDTNWRLLQARSKGARSFGAHLLSRWSPQDFSV